MDGTQPSIPGACAISASAFQVIEEEANKGSIEVFDPDLRGSGIMRPSGVAIEWLTFRVSIAPGILMPQSLGEPNCVCAPAGSLTGRIMKSTANDEGA